MNPRNFCLIPLLLLPACGIDKPAKGDESSEITKKTTPDDPQLVGRIASIPADKRFVLIQSYGKWDVAAGTILTTRGPDDRTANLLATGEALGEFAAADLQSGLLEVGDAVYFRHAPKPVTPPPSETPPDTDASEAPENVQKIIKFPRILCFQNHFSRSIFKKSRPENTARPLNI